MSYLRINEVFSWLWWYKIEIWGKLLCFSSFFRRISYLRNIIALIMSYTYIYIRKYHIIQICIYWCVYAYTTWLRTYVPYMIWNICFISKKFQDKVEQHIFAVIIVILPSCEQLKVERAASSPTRSTAYLNFHQKNWIF